MYTLALQTNQEKLDKILLEIETVKKNLSNFSINVDEVIEMCCKLGVLWQESSLDICQKLQNIIFPEGIFWNKENSTYRTEKTNKAIELMARISTIYKQKKRGRYTLVSQLVRVKGLEPPRLSAPDPKSGAATNYATPAWNLRLQR